MTTDWYEQRNDLEPGQIFETKWGSRVMLDHRKPGDGTDWVVADWDPDNKSWAYYEHSLHPADLVALIEQ